MPFLKQWVVLAKANFTQVLNIDVPVVNSFRGTINNGENISVTV